MPTASANDLTHVFERAVAKQNLGLLPAVGAGQFIHVERGPLFGVPGEEKINHKRGERERGERERRSVTQ
jgi:hypothetical protein